jgi:hypothetical protein
MQQFADILKSAVTEPGIISKAYSAFHNYSIGNQIAAAVQLTMRGLPVAPIASFVAWKNKGRSVKKGEKAICLCLPVTVKGEKEVNGEKTEFSFNRFIWKNNWFSVDQTEGDEFKPEISIPQWDAAKAMQSLEISQVSFNMLNGNCQGYASERTIAINPVAEFPHKTRFHEMAHIVLGHTSEGVMTDSETTPRDVREVEAESVAFILCTLLELPGKTESRGYIQNWLNGAAITEKSAQRIFSAADKILKAGATTH